MVEVKDIASESSIDYKLVYRDVLAQLPGIRLTAQLLRASDHTNSGHYLARLQLASKGVLHALEKQIVQSCRGVVIYTCKFAGAQ